MLLRASISIFEVRSGFYFEFTSIFAANRGPHMSWLEKDTSSPPLYYPVRFVALLWP
jgi:hypothetical protein